MTADHQETRPRGRPPIGPDVKYRLPAGLRQALADAMRPGESEAAAVRRLLTVALHPLTASALRMAAEHYETRAAEFCLACEMTPDGKLSACPDHALMIERAVTLGGLADDASTPADDTGRRTLLATLGAKVTAPATQARQASTGPIETGGHGTPDDPRKR